MARNHYISGEWNLICDCCGKKIKAHEAKQRWDGFIVCPEDYETRHPQDFVRARADKITVPFTRPRPVDLFVDDGNRTIFDTILLTDIVNREINRGISDRLNLDDAGQDYIDSTYFLEDYLEGNGLIINITKILSDTLLLNDSGGVNIQDYVESSYFAQDYVGTTTLF